METEQTKTIYDLELHEEINITDTLIVQRVPGGWNYKYYRYKFDRNHESWEEELSQIVFVRYHNEFQIKTGNNF